MPGYCPAGRSPVWERLPAEKPQRPWEWRLLRFVVLVAIRLQLANGCRSKSGAQVQRARLQPQGLWFRARLPGEDENPADSAAWAALPSRLGQAWSSPF